MAEYTAWGSRFTDEAQTEAVWHQNSALGLSSPKVTASDVRLLIPHGSRRWSNTRHGFELSYVQGRTQTFSNFVV